MCIRDRFNTLVYRQGRFEAFNVYDAETFSPYLVIRKGKIVCVKDAVINYSGRELDELKTQSVVYYHRTGKPYRVANHQRSERRRNYWSRSHRSRKNSWGQQNWRKVRGGWSTKGSVKLYNLNVGGGYNSSNRRIMNLRVLFQPLHRGRWKSVHKTEYRSVRYSY